MRLVFGCKNTALWILVAVKHTQNKTLGILFKQWNLKCYMFRPDDGLVEPKHVAFKFHCLNKIPSVLFCVCLTASNIHLRNTHWDVPPEHCTVDDTV